MGQTKINKNQPSEHLSLQEQHRQRPSQHPSSTNTLILSVRELHAFFALAFTASSALKFPGPCPVGQSKEVPRTGRAREGLLQQAGENRKKP